MSRARVVRADCCSNRTQRPAVGSLRAADRRPPHRHLLRHASLQKVFDRSSLRATDSSPVATAQVDSVALAPPRQRRELVESQVRARWSVPPNGSNWSPRSASSSANARPPLSMSTQQPSSQRRYATASPIRSTPALRPHASEHARRSRARAAPRAAPRSPVRARRRSTSLCGHP